MPTLHQDTGITSYDDAVWTEWMPDLDFVVDRPGMRCLYQVVPAETILTTEVLVPAAVSTTLLFWTRGQHVKFSLGRQSSDIRARVWDFTLLPSGMDSWWLSTPEASDGVFHIHLDQTCIDQVLASDDKFLRVAQLPPMSQRGDLFVRETARWIYDEVRWGGTPSQLFWDSAALTLAHRLLRIAEAKPPPIARGGLAAWQIKRVSEYMTASLVEDMTLAELAGIAQLSPTHFSRAFKRSTGRSPIQQLVAMRVERGKAMLVDPALLIIEIAAACGYDSPSRFAQIFKRATGLTPTEWRRRH